MLEEWMMTIQKKAFTPIHSGRHEYAFSFELPQTENEGVKQLVANLRGESLSSGKTETWNGKQLKIPPVSPSILDCSIIRVEYSLMVYVDIPGAMDLFLNLPLVIGTIPLHPFGSRTSSVSSQCSMNMNWLGLTLPERPEAPPSYAEVVTEEQRQSSLAPLGACDDFERALPGPLFAYIQEFRFLPPPPLFRTWTLSAYAHAQNCPSRLIMYHLFSLDPIVDLFTNIKCLQANPSCY
ncbi:hypothetical protein DUI87_04904 [Hirundo rustica rustica]|uniref:Arrestin C-terminal-like domain-containing protein n=1 Tax=Hirundo rustica rustica TaxID=333673 RepID=A0A3M0KZ08_HIRRU|nr:hypothetical protein DUI87_04904 [Hirundo rustica rustica]